MYSTTFALRSSSGTDQKCKNGHLGAGNTRLIEKLVSSGSGGERTVTHWTSCVICGTTAPTTEREAIARMLDNPKPKLRLKALEAAPSLGVVLRPKVEVFTLMTIRLVVV